MFLAGFSGSFSSLFPSCCFGLCSLRLHLDVVPLEPFWAHLDGGVRGWSRQSGCRTKGGVCISPRTPVARFWTTIVPPASAPRAVTATLSGGIRRLSSAGRGRGRVDGRTLPRTCSAARSLGLPRSARVLKRCVDLGSTSHLPASICCCTSLTVRVGAARYGAPPSRYPFREEQRDCSRVAGHACGARCRRPSFTPEEVGTRFPRLLSTPHGWRL